MGNLLNKQEQYELIVENILLKIPKSKVKQWQIRTDKDQARSTLSSMRGKCDHGSFEGLKVQPCMLLEYIDEKYKYIFHCEYYA